MTCYFNFTTEERKKKEFKQFAEDEIANKQHIQGSLSSLSDTKGILQENSHVREMILTSH